jgi:hypothetical protein
MSHSENSGLPWSDHDAEVAVQTKNIAGENVDEWIRLFNASAETPRPIAALYMKLARLDVSRSPEFMTELARRRRSEVQQLRAAKKKRLQEDPVYAHEEESKARKAFERRLREIKGRTVTKKVAVKTKILTEMPPQGFATAIDAVRHINGGYTPSWVYYRHKQGEVRKVVVNGVSFFNLTDLKAASQRAGKTTKSTLGPVVTQKQQPLTLSILDMLQRQLISPEKAAELINLTK